VKASVKTPAKRRRAKTFADGFVMGLAAPSLLVSGFLTDVNPSKTSGVGKVHQTKLQRASSSPGGRSRQQAPSLNRRSSSFNRS
jgi:hypothetical protein